jgi:putative phosphoribosyl transferase
MYANSPDVLVLALPRGGVPVAYEVSRALHAPLDVIIVRKLGVSGQEELAMGAIASGGVRVLNEDIVRVLRIPEEVIHEVVTREQREVKRRERLYRGNRPAYEMHGRTVILVDDGIATGATMRAAVVAVKQRQPARIIIAVPVAASATYEEFVMEVDEVVCILKPEDFFAVGVWYERFAQTTDQEVADLLAQAAQERVSAPQKPRKTLAPKKREQHSRTIPPIWHGSRRIDQPSHISRNAQHRQRSPQKIG